ncbi:hypothetical protein Tco_0443990 [Tanacetum coccineum]
MSPRSIIWGQAKGSPMGDLCPSALSAIFTTMARAPKGATSATKYGHFALDCRSTGNTNVTNLLRRAMGQLPREMVVLSVEHQGISREIV